MTSRFHLWASVLVMSLAGIGLCIRVLALEGVPVSESLIVRGLGCLALVILFSHHQNLPLKPKSVKTQVFRAVLAGLALTFLTMSYNWLSASAVSVLSNIDVPLLVLLGPIVGVPAFKRTRALALLAILFLVWYVSGIEIHQDLFKGLSSLALGSVLLCFGYLYIKKSMSEENEAVAILTPSLAIIVYGIAEAAVESGFAHLWTPSQAALALLSGVLMFVAYAATMRLYELTDLASAEFPTLISAIVIQPLEAVLLNEPLKPVYLASSIGFVAVVYLILKTQHQPAEAHAH